MSVELVGYPASPQQLRRFRLAEEGRGETFRARCRLRLRGAPEAQRCGAVLARVVARQAILRTRLERLPGMSLPVQVEGPPGGGAFPLARIDLAGLTGAARDAALAALWRLRRPAGAPFEARLLVLPAAEAALDLDLPPWGADEPTLDLLAAEVGAALAAAVEGEEGDGEGQFRYAQYAAWRNGLAEEDEAAEGRAFWEGLHLRDTPQLALPADAPHLDPAAFTPRRATRLLPAPQADLLRQAAGTIGVPLDVFVLAAWHALLFRWTGLGEGLSGRLVWGREHELLARLLGPLAEAVPVRASLAPDLQFAELARRLGEWCDETAAWQEHFRLADAVAPAAPGEEPWGFSAVFAWRDETAPAAPPGTPAAAPAAIAVERRHLCAERCDLLLQATPAPFDALQPGPGGAAGAGGGIALTLVYDAARRQHAAADRLLAQLATLAASAAAAPATPLARLALLPPAEIEAVTAALCGPQGVPAADLLPLHRLFAAQAARTPDRVAVACGDEALTYAALDARANRLARHLRAAGLAAEGVAGILLDRSLDLMVTLWAILKAGGAYLPLDPLHPPARLLAMVEAAGARLVVARGALAGMAGAGAASPWRVVDLDADRAAIASQPATALPEGTAADCLAYVLFTSGTTGRPKGVMVEQRSVANLLGALRRRIYDRHAEAGRPLVVGLNAPLVFDAAVKQWVQLLSGHTLRLVPEEVRPDGEAFAAFVRASGIDVVDCTPSQLRGLLAAGFAAAGEGGPRAVLVGGEAIDAATWGRLVELEAVGPARFYNVYGPTECTVDATAMPLAAAEPRLPTLGRPLPGVHAAIVGIAEAQLEPVPHGAAGELLIGGAGVARGYLGQPDLTALRFVPDPRSTAAGGRLYRTGDLVRLTARGEIEFLGRRDHQVKVRGFRIELEEVEAALLDLAAIRQAAVRRWEDGAGARLVAYVALDDGTAAGEGELRAALRRRLPEPMVPAQIVTLRDLPLTASGKLDRAALPPPDRVRPARAPFVAPASAAERTVAAVWAEVLGVEQVGRDDNFFDLGGHSLLMVRAHGRLEEAFGQPVSMVEMFRLPTVAALAAHLVHGAAAPEAPAALTAAQERGARQRQAEERQRQAMARARERR